MPRVRNAPSAAAAVTVSRGGIPQPHHDLLLRFVSVRGDKANTLVKTVMCGILLGYKRGAACQKHPQHQLPLRARPASLRLTVTHHRNRFSHPSLQQTPPFPPSLSTSHMEVSGDPSLPLFSGSRSVMRLGDGQEAKRTKLSERPVLSHRSDEWLETGCETEPCCAVRKVQFGSVFSKNEVKAR
ncbi:hypothetical protein Q8A73_009082 [Channa argus]|nr:hypothetical protein Q8A73_009082 [Channa argus]